MFVLRVDSRCLLFEQSSVRQMLQKVVNHITVACIYDQQCSHIHDPQR